MMTQISAFISAFTAKMMSLAHFGGYKGLWIVMFLESTCIPILIPTELVLFIAGYLVSDGSMNYTYAVLVSLSATIAGSIFSYLGFRIVGRPLIKKLSYIIGDKAKILGKLERHFIEHANITVFLGRLVPVFKHYIAVPAGIYKMNFVSFIFFTMLGGAIFCSISIYLGMIFGHNDFSWREASHYINYLAIASALLLLIYVIHRVIKRLRVKK